MQVVYVYAICYCLRGWRGEIRVFRISFLIFERKFLRSRHKTAQCRRWSLCEDLPVPEHHDTVCGIKVAACKVSERANKSVDGIVPESPMMKAVTPNCLNQPFEPSKLSMTVSSVLPSKPVKGSSSTTIGAREYSTRARA